MGVTLTAVWTTLGVGSVAVALALQETLSNFFSGLYLVADRPISPNDYIKLDTNQEGYVLRIGWRSTVLRTLGNNLRCDSQLHPCQSHHHQLFRSRAAHVFLRAGERCIRNRSPSGRKGPAGSRPRGHPGRSGRPARKPAPSVSFIPGFGESSLDFSLGMQIRQFTDQFPVQSELRKRIVKKFCEAGVSMPFPTRNLLLDKATQDLASGTSQS